jgi:hypothetical protein
MASKAPQTDRGVVAVALAAAARDVGLAVAGRAAGGGAVARLGVRLGSAGSQTKDPDKIGQAGNAKVNTTNQGYQQDRCRSRRAGRCRVPCRTGWRAERGVASSTPGPPRLRMCRSVLLVS